MIASTEAAYRAGRIACADGKRQDANPQPAEAAEHGYWNRGWLDEFRSLPEALRASRMPKEAGHVD